MAKKGALDKVGRTDVQDSFGDAMGGNERPWWLPEDLEGQADLMADAMVAGLSERQKLQIMHQDPRQMTKKQKQELFQSFILGGIESPNYRTQLAKSALMKPLEFAKIMASQTPKAQEITGEITHRPAIVVPATLSDDAWNDGQKLSQKVLTEGWEANSPWGNVQEAEVVED